MRIAIYPGTFDPFTNGHLDIVKRSVKLFDRVLVAVAAGTHKSPVLSFEKRLSLIESALKPFPQVDTIPLEGLLVDCAKAHQATFVVRGIRDNRDFEYERQLGNMNAILSPGLETVYLTAKPEHADISSTLIRDILRHGGDISQFVPPEIAEGLIVE